MLDYQNLLFLVIGRTICLTLCHWYIFVKLYHAFSLSSKYVYFRVLKITDVNRSSMIIHFIVINHL